jgi:hypothetical protein
MQTVHDLSKDVDPLAEDDNSDNDPEVVIHEEDDDDDEDEYVDDEVEEESIGTPEEEEGDIVDFDADDNADVGDGGGGAAEVTRCKYLFSCIPDECFGLIYHGRKILYFPFEKNTIRMLT